MQEHTNINDAALDIQRLLPHRAPFLLVDGVSLEPEHCQCPHGQQWQAFGHCTVRQDNPFVRSDGSVESVAFAEMLAQCAGALGFLGHSTEGIAELEGAAEVAKVVEGAEQGAHKDIQEGAQEAAPPIGYLAAMRPVRMLARAHVGDVLQFYVRQSATVGAISLVEGKVFLDALCVAEGQFKIFVQNARV